MLMVISPAKTLDFDTPLPPLPVTQPDFLDESGQLVEILRGKSPAELAALMSISDKLAVLNAGRYSQWHRPFTSENARPAVYAFMGDVYEGLDVASLPAEAVDYLQAHLCILSGLYGVLRPLDLMQAYRLEMGTRLANERGRDLYTFWGERITQALNARLAGTTDPVLVNLASEEYFKAVRPASLNAAIVTPVFQDRKGGQYKIISFHAKRARGAMVRWAAERRLASPERLKDFDTDGYRFAPEASDTLTWVFRRDEG
ncbi:Cytoplasmic iron level regulating protein YaaA, DUF328/UPF0246 family [Gulbenkiania indica]|uniref:UPF0246 protein Ga0061063_0972 n=1 Tax=Gulbenkiania indica TaxID=375574 RepID=A0A0K6GTT0_9NEIS|nr:peroxide stress protein YaaA [Gulbenkiania indica]CUA82116.1 Cytoplasmic iron level regulating protein YaaA, DUF328/UPF0246 family [Gulbenkiania indica]